MAENLRVHLFSRFGGSRLLRKLLKGGAWMGAASATEYTLRFVRNMILARLVAPEAFGLMAIVLSVCALFQVLTGLGLKECIVQSPRGGEKEFLNGAWWLSFCRGLFLYGTSLLAAPWIADFYNAPELTGLLRVAFISVLAQSAMSLGAMVAVKQMRYKPWVFIQQGGSILGITTTLTLAFWLKGVWALVLGYAAEGLLRCLLSYLICPFRPGLTFRRDDLRALLHFARGLFGLPLLMLVYNEGAVFTVGKLCTKEQLGIFAMALTLARIPSIFSSQLLDLLMPAFSEIQRDGRRVRQGILKITTLAVLFGLPGAVFIAIFGRQILSVAYGARYAGGSVALSILFLNELLLVCGVPMATVYMALGKPALLRRFSMMRAALMVTLAWPLINTWGIAGAALLPLCAMLGAYGFQLARLRELIALDIREYLRIWQRGVLVALPSALFWLFTSPVLASMKPLVGLFITAFISALVAVLSIALALKRDGIKRFLWPFAAGVR